MIKRLHVIILLLILTTSCIAQLKWPTITQVNKPWTRWWWEGSAVNKKDLTRSMQLYQQAGLGGLEITPIYGVKGSEKEFISYLSPPWMDMLDHTLKEAKRLNLGIDMATGTGWPFGGPWITPEDACKNIQLKTWSLKTGEQLNELVLFQQEPLVRMVSGRPVDIKTLSYPIASNKDLQAFAFDQVKFPIRLPLQLLIAYSDKGGVVDLTTNVDSTGKLTWVAPEGNWNLYALFQGWHGKLVERAAPGGEGDVIDHFSLQALNNYLKYFDKAFAGKDINGIRAFFNDSYEVDDARGQANWTPELFSEFQQRRGYDLRLHLPALFLKDSAAKNSRVLWDYRQTISELILEKFTTPWDNWAKAKGKTIRNQSHGSPANILDLYAAIDMPETEGTDLLRFKFATSAANVNGKALASAEAATWLDEHFLSSLGDVKQSVDKYFLGGVNHIFYHGTNYSPQSDPWPGWLFYAAVHFTPANPFWKDFGTLNNYVARCQSFLQAGKPDNDILLYFPINDRFSEPGNALLQHFDGMEGFQNTTFRQSAEFLLEEGYAFDLISDKQVLNLTSANNALQTGGVNYKTIVVSDSRLLPLETMSKLVQLAGAGATIIFHKNLPQDVPGFGNLQQRRQQYNALLTSLSFNIEATAGIKTAAVGNGFILLGDNLSGLLTAARVRKENLKPLGLQAVRRQLPEGTVYFISNPGKTKVESWVPLQVTATAAMLFDPMTEKAGLAKTRNTNGILEVYLQLNPGASCILQTSATAVTGNKFPYYSKGGTPVNISGSWNLKFLEGGPALPATTSLKALQSWTSLPGEKGKSFSGTASYTTRFARPSTKADAWLLDLGRVEESAEVFLNGKRIATLIGPAYEILIPAAAIQSSNALEVKVTNGMANRIIDLEKKGVQWKKFYNTNFPSRLPANRGSDGLFTAAKWEPLPSGLLGPVTLTPVAYDK
jgi:hypothetical protein